MWFLSARKTRLGPYVSSGRSTFRPRLEVLEDRCLLSAGALDPTFGTGGLLTGAPTGLGLTSVVQPDGKSVFGFWKSSDSYFTMERYNADGSVDTAFGNNGIASAPIGVGLTCLKALALQSDGKIVGVGWAHQTTSSLVFAVARFNPNGSLDNTFGSNGTVMTQLANGRGSVDYANAVAIDGNGKIDVAGSSSGSIYWNLGLVRYNANGTLDTTFGKKGIVLTQPNSNFRHYATALAFQSDGKVILAGNRYNPMGNGDAQTMEVVRYTPTGQLDSTFGSSGVVAGLAPSGSATAEAMRVLVQSNGGIAVAGVSDFGAGYKLTVARLTSAGQLDTTFGKLGFAINSSVSVFEAGTLRFSYGVNLLGFAQAANGDLLISGYTVNANNDTDFAVAAFLPTGTADTTFDTGGVATADFGGGNDYACALYIQGDGKILVAGITTPFGSSVIDVALARFLAS